MADYIAYKSHSETFTREGHTATLQIICDWASKDTARPTYGSAHPTLSGLYCVEVKGAGEGAPTDEHVYTYWRWDCTYAASQQETDDPLLNMEFGGEMLETGVGRTWTTAGTKCDQSQGIWYPSVTLNYQITLATLPFDAIMAVVGKVNSGEFLNCAAETLLFEGASTDTLYNPDALPPLMQYTYRINLRFIYRPRSHNTVWRMPRQERDAATGVLKYDETTGDPVYVITAAGTGGWDTPSPALYETGDFYPLFGWTAPGGG